MKAEEAITTKGLCYNFQHGISNMVSKPFLAWICPSWGVSKFVCRVVPSVSVPLIQEKFRWYAWFQLVFMVSFHIDVKIIIGVLSLN